MRVEIIPCLQDNYAYLLIEDGQAIVVDACETAPILAAVEQSDARLVAVLATHHHHDHVGGNTDLVARWPGTEVYGHASDQARTPGLTKPLEHGARFTVAGFDVQALHVPGHTLGALTYVTNGWAFTGDTLFLAGCGRLFEGTPAQMLHSLRDVLGALPDDTLVACGHEYTSSNLRFAKHVEPDNADVEQRVQDASTMLSAEKRTVPSPLALERKTNPFLRVDEPAVRAHLGLDANVPSADVFAALRKEKDGFR